MSLFKSKQRVADHGEVFTPSWMAEAMLDLVKGETERIDSRFLEPACGSGNFLVRILQRKLAAVELKFGKSDFERRHFALLALTCTYGIELLADNIAECRANMLEILANYLNLKESEDLYRAASYVLSQNLVHGDALTMRTNGGQAITFAEWGYLGKGKFQRRDFRLDTLTVLTDARLRPITLGRQVIRFRAAAPSRLHWAGRPAMRIVQALYWLQDMLDSDRPRIIAQLQRILDDPAHGNAMRSGLMQGLPTLPIWMQSVVREVFERKTNSPRGPRRPLQRAMHRQPSTRS